MAVLPQLHETARVRDALRLYRRLWSDDVCRLPVRGFVLCACDLNATLAALTPQETSEYRAGAAQVREDA